MCVSRTEQVTCIYVAQERLRLESERVYTCVQIALHNERSTCMESSQVEQSWKRETTDQGPYSVT